MGGSTGLSWLYLINMQSSYGREETGEIIWPFCEPVMPISYKINDKIKNASHLESFVNI